MFQALVQFCFDAGQPFTALAQQHRDNVSCFPDCTIYAKGKLTLITLTYFRLNHGDERVFYFEIIINVLVALSALFEYLCHGSYDF